MPLAEGLEAELGVQSAALAFLSELSSPQEPLERADADRRGNDAGVRAYDARNASAIAECVLQMWATSLRGA